MATLGSNSGAPTNVMILNHNANGFQFLVFVLILSFFEFCWLKERTEFVCRLDEERVACVKPCCFPEFVGMCDKDIKQEGTCLVLDDYLLHYQKKLKLSQFPKSLHHLKSE